MALPAACRARTRAVTGLVATLVLMAGMSGEAWGEHQVSNTSPPTISGIAQVGQTLTADPGTWSGREPITYAYRWRRCDSDGSDCNDIAGATEKTYTLTTTDIGRRVRVQVTATNSAGSRSANSAPTATVTAATAAPPSNGSAPTVTGLAEDGQTLSASPGAWTGAQPITFVYRWQRCSPLTEACNDILGATAQTYRLSPADVGATVRVSVTASNSVGASSASSSPTATVAARPPVNDSPPTISGVAKDGQVLTAEPGSWSGTPPVDFAYQWRRCDGDGSNCTDIAEATAKTYRLSPADVGATVRVSVTASNAGGSSAAGSAPTATVAAAAPVNDSPPTVSGQAEDGQVLTAEPGSWSGTPPVDFAYQWQRCDGDGSSCTDIAGATAKTYRLSPADVGTSVKIRVTARNSVSSAAASSDPTATVAAAPPSNDSPPTITGLAEDGRELSADPGSWSGTPPIDFAYQWQRCDGGGSNCTDIAGATAKTYRLSPADVGASAKVRVTARNSVSSAVASSDPTATVAAARPSNNSPPTISGLAEDGQVLTAKPGSWKGTPPIDFAYQWQRCDGADCSDVAEATAQTYRLSPADVGATVRVSVTASNAGGSSTAGSAQTTAVAATPPVNRSRPSISGVAEAGQTLTLDPGDWSGTPPLEYDYEWRRCDTSGMICSPIAGAGAESYTLTPAEVGSTIRVRVIATNSAGSLLTRTLPTATVAAAPLVNDSPPTISGVAEDGRELTAEPGSWTGTPPVDFAYQWRRCDSGGSNCTDIAGATAKTYRLSPADVGATVRVSVTASNAGGSSTAGSAPTITVAAAPPVNDSPPRITGLPEDGRLLTAEPGSWRGTPPIDFAYQWRRCDGGGSNCTDIAGATAKTFRLSPADVGATLRVSVTASNAGGSSTAGSAPTAAVAEAPPVNNLPPTISGLPEDGQVLTAKPGSWKGTPPVDYAYQWERCSSLTEGCSDILEATGESYRLRPNDVGSQVRVRVTAKNSAGSSAATSDPTASVAATPPVNRSRPSISGVAEAGQTLTLDPGDWSGTPPLEYDYEWRRCDTSGMICSPIAGADAESYTLTPAEVGSTIRVRIIATNSAGSTLARTLPTEVVAAASATPPVNSAPPTISGRAEDGGELTAAIGSWSGTEPIDFSFQWQRCAGAGCSDIAEAKAKSYSLSSADVGHKVRVQVTAKNPGGASTVSSDPSEVVAAVVMAAGDLNPNRVVGGEPGAVAQLMRAENPTFILGLGDYQYSYGSLSAILAGFDKNFGPKPGGLWPLFRPAVGNHDAASATDTADYRSYWGRDPYEPYSFDVGNWHVIALPSVAYAYGLDTAAILNWLRDDLNANTKPCTLAYWHHPYWSRPTAEHRRTTAVRPWVQALYDHRAEVILTGHQHNYQRFAPQTPGDALDTERGIRGFVVGTGGKSRYMFTGTAANVEASDNSTVGALRLSLQSNSYEWKFQPIPGSTYTDSGSDTCH